MTRYETRPKGNGFQIWDRFLSVWVWGTWTTHKSTAERVAQKWNDQYKRSQK